MSLRDTRDIGTAKIVMLGGGGGGGSYAAGNGISITNNVITNTRKGALTGVIDSVSSNIAHTQIDNALTTTTAGALVVLKAEASGTSINTVRVQYGSQASESNDFRLRDTDGNYTTIDIASDDTIIMMLNATGYQMIVLSILGASTGGGYSGLGIGKKKTVTNNVIDTDIDLHRAPIVGDRLLVYFDESVQNPTGLTTYNNGTAITSGLENATLLYFNAGWNILEYKNNLLVTGWARVQNVPIPNNTLSGLSDTAIISPSDGQMLAYDNSSSKWKNKTIAANNGGTPVRELKTLQIGDAVFDAFGLKTFDVTSVTSGVNGAIAVDVITASQLNGEIIAVHTGSNTGSTGNAWTLALSDSQTVEALTMSKADGTAFTEALTANSLMFVKIDTSNDTAVVLGIVGAGSNVSGNGSGSPVSYLNKLKIGSAIYDTSAIRPFSVAQIANNSVKIYVADIDQLDGKVIALSTGALTGTTSSAWSLNLVDTSSGAASLDVDMLNADGTAFSDDITANELLFVAIDLTNYEGVILSVVGKSEDEIKTATGNPITLTDALPYPAVSLSTSIEPIQEGEGDPSPTNIRPISGRTKTSADAYSKAEYAPFFEGVKNGTYGFVDLGSLTWSYSSGNNSRMSATLSGAKGATDAQTFNGICKEYTSTTINNVYYHSTTDKVIGIKSNGTIMIRDDSFTNAAAFKTAMNGVYLIYELATPTTPSYTDAQWKTLVNSFDGNDATISFGQTVYGGIVDFKTGKVTITDGYIASYNGETLPNTWISDRDVYAVGTTPTTGAEVVYKLVTPTEITVSPATLTLLSRYNYITADGNMSITYKASGLDALKERVDELEDAVEDLTADVASKTENSVVGTVENSTTASQPYAVGEHFIRNNKFCTCIATIASGATLTQGTNYVEGTIAEAITNKCNYSTTEHVVGKWIDGKTLYERTFEVGNLPSGGDKKYDTLIPTSTIPATNVKGLYGQATSSSNGMIPLPYTNGGNNTTYDVGMAIIVQNNKLAIFLHSAANRSDFTATVTMQYTKP